MGSESEFPEPRVPSYAVPPELVLPPRPVDTSRPREPRMKYLVLFALTVVTTTIVGAGHYDFWANGFSTQPRDLTWWSMAATGLWYSASVLAILGCHEFGHYYACRFYGVDSSLPYFLPAPVLFTGTFGAVIRIRQPLPSKRALFDIGIAGPIAGFVVAVPLLLIGAYLSRVVPSPESVQGDLYELGEPLLFKLAMWLTFGPVPDNQTVIMHPVAFAAWFGLLATALNLLPIGQLDGGHVSYAVLGSRSVYVTLATVVCVVGLIFVSTSWVVWAVLTIGMLFAFGPRHPPVWDEHVPLDRTRLWLAAFALVMLVVCFTPAPITLVDLLR